VHAGYLISLLASLLLYMHPLRGCLAEILWAEDVLHIHTATAANPAAGTQQATSGSSSSSSAYAVPGSQQQQQQDHNPIDDSRVLLAFDSMDQPAFGSWKPGGHYQLGFECFSGVCLIMLYCTSQRAQPPIGTVCKCHTSWLSQHSVGGSCRICVDSMDQPAFSSWKPGGHQLRIIRTCLVEGGFVVM
jgi:hypothetical protein